MSTAIAGAEWVRCSCCGRSIPDTKETNRDFESRGQDTGFGHCTDCYGEPPAPETTPRKGKKDWPSESDTRKRIGWAGQMFYDARIEQVRKALTAENRAKFDATPYSKKIAIIGRMIEKGYMV